MRTQLNAELIKLATVRTTWLFLAVTGVVVALAVLAQAITAGGDAGLPPLADLETQRMLFSSGTGIAPVVAVVFGTLGVATELRHHTMASTLLCEPRRGVVLAAKGIASAGAGVAVGITAGVTAAASAWVVLLVTGTENAVTSQRILSSLGGTALAAALAALLGLGIGGIVRNQAAAIGVALLLLLAVEPLVGSFVPDLMSWMPSQIATRIAGASPDADPAMLASVATYLGYVAVAMGGAFVAMTRADV